MKPSGPRSTGASILVVDDDADIREMLESTLAYSGYQVFTVSDAAAAIRQIRTDPPDVLLADVMMPTMDGYALVHLLRDAGDSTPILFLSARDTVEDRVRGLRTGADDYLTKPFSIVEVTARIDALLRRSKGNGQSAGSILSSAGVSVDPDRHRVTVDGEEVALTATEFKLLELLIANRGRVISKSQILENIWGYHFAADTNIVERFVANLRRKIRPVGGDPIQTVRGFGYRMDDRP